MGFRAQLNPKQSLLEICNLIISTKTPFSKQGHIHRNYGWDLDIRISFEGIQFNLLGFTRGSAVKNSPANAGVSSTPGLRRSPGEGNDNPLQYSCLGNPIDMQPARFLCLWDYKRGAIVQPLNNNNSTCYTCVIIIINIMISCKRKKSQNHSKEEKFIFCQGKSQAERTMLIQFPKLSGTQTAFILLVRSCP